MKIITNFEPISDILGSVVTIGSFDGVHRGHRQVLQQLCQTAQEKALPSIVVTFEPHPQQVLDQNPDFFLISTLEQKIELLSQQKIDYIYIIPFTKEFAELTSEEFIKQVLIDKLKTRYLIMGPNHRFGKNRSGTYSSTHHLAELQGIDILMIEEYLLDDIAVRSTQIRKKIAMGNFEEAEELLGHSLFIRNN